MTQTVTLSVGLGQGNDLVLFHNDFGEERIAFRKMKLNDLIFIDLGKATKRSLTGIQETLERLKAHVED